MSLIGIIIRIQRKRICDPLNFYFSKGLASALVNTEPEVYNGDLYEFKYAQNGNHVEHSQICSKPDSNCLDRNL